MSMTRLDLPLGHWTSKWAAPWDRMKGPTSLFVLLLRAKCTLLCISSQSASVCVCNPVTQLFPSHQSILIQSAAEHMRSDIMYSSPFPFLIVFSCVLVEWPNWSYSMGNSLAAWHLLTGTETPAVVTLASWKRRCALEANWNHKSGKKKKEKKKDPAWRRRLCWLESFGIRVNGMDGPHGVN